MGLKTGEKIQFKIMPNKDNYQATVISEDSNNILLQCGAEQRLNISDGSFVVVPWEDGDYYTSVIAFKNDKLHLQKMWFGDRRQSFRIDDILVLKFAKTDKDPSVRKSKAYKGYSSDVAYDMDEVDESISPQMWRLLIDINTKLGLILERLYFENEVFLYGEERKVNLSAAGVRFTTDENIITGDDLEIKLFLPTTPPTLILTYGHVVRVKDIGNNEHEIAAHFINISDSVRDEIIHYTLNKQREVIRMQKW